MESDVASFVDVGTLLKRTAPVNLNVFYPSCSFHNVTASSEKKIIQVIKNTTSIGRMHLNLLSEL